jgi:hypothetical protein
VTERARRHAKPSERAARRRLLLVAAALLAVFAIAGSAIAISGSMTGIPAIDDLLDRTSSPSVGVEPGAPSPAVRPVPGTLSEPLSFEHDGKTLTAIGFRSEAGMICSALVDSAATPEKPVGGVGCLSARLLPDELARSPLHIFAGGGHETRDILGFARADVVAVTRVDGGGAGTIALSEPWKPWDGEPIRFFYSVTTVPDPSAPTDLPLWKGLRLKVELASGESVEIRR